MHETFRKHCVDPRPSLRKRLFLALLAIFVIAWICAAVYISAEMMRDRGGLRDRWLVDVAQEILLSMPSAVVQFKATDNLQLGEERMPATEKMGRMNFQVWSKAGRVLAVRSSNAPAPPLKPDFADGFATVMVDGEEWRVYATSDARNEVQVQIAKPTAEFIAETRKWIRIGVGLSLVALCLIGIALKLVIRWTMRSIVAMQETMKARDALDLRPLPDGDLPDEVLPLVDSFNRLLARLDGAVQSERQFLAEAAHELRTPLAVLLTHAQVAARSRTLEEARGPLQQLVHGVERSARLSQQLLDSARLDVEGRAGLQCTLELADIVSVVTDEYEIMAAQKGQAITLDAEGGAIVGNVDELGILIGNLVDNAVRYTPRGGRVAVRCQRAGDRVQLQVLDDGPGVDADDRARVFDRFYRVAGSNERGSGIGLSLVARIAQSHQATIETGAGLDGRGFGVTVCFPPAPSDAPSASREPGSRPTAGGHTSKAAEGGREPGAAAA